MNKTEREVWEFMMEYQGNRQKPPTLDEIAGNVEDLTWRSGPKYVMKGLVNQGMVEVTGKPGTSRRYMAVEPDTEDYDEELISRFVPTERL